MNMKLTSYALKTTFSNRLIVTMATRFKTDGHWVFGGIERGSGECLLVEVEKRDAATLLPLIYQHVRPGSTVLSDEWSSYSQLTAITGNTHLAVNHSLHFVDPTTGAHTQSVEGMWSCCKRMMWEEKVMNCALFWDLSPWIYVEEKIWRAHCIWEYLETNRTPLPCSYSIIKTLYFIQSWGGNVLVKFIGCYSYELLSTLAWYMYQRRCPEVRLCVCVGPLTHFIL